MVSFFFLDVWTLHATGVHHFHRITAAVIVPRHHLFAPAGVSAAHHREFVHFGHAFHHVVFGHFHHHVDGVTSHGVTGNETTDHFHSARLAETVHEFVHEHLAIFHGHARQRFQGEAHHDDVAFRARLAHGHHWHALHQRARDLVDAIVAHAAHVRVFGVFADRHLAFHGSHGVGEFHHHHEHARTAQAHLPHAHAGGAVAFPHHLAFGEFFLPHVAAFRLHLVHAHHVAFHHVGVHGHRHFWIDYLRL